MVKDHDLATPLIETHHFVLRNVEDLLLDDLGLVLGQEVQDGLRVGCGLDEWVLREKEDKFSPTSP